MDPDPRVSGRGIALLQEAGIEVTVGVEAQACRDLNEAFIHRVTHQRPFGILKYAMTLDGKIATTQGQSAWVTNESARTQVHQLRASCDAVIVGSNTVRQDNPRLTTHRLTQVGDRPPHNPLRVVMSRSLNLPQDAKLWQIEAAPTLVLTQGNPKPEFQDWLRQQGVEVINLEQLTSTTAMTVLYDRGLSSILWECGGVLAARAIAEGAIQKVLAFVAPRLWGVREPPPLWASWALQKWEGRSSWSGCGGRLWEQIASWRDIYRWHKQAVLGLRTTCDLHHQFYASALSFMPVHSRYQSRG